MVNTVDQWAVRCYLKAKKTHGFKSCIVLSVYPLDIVPSIENAREYHKN